MLPPAHCFNSLSIFQPPQARLPLQNGREENCRRPAGALAVLRGSIGQGERNQEGEEKGEAGLLSLVSMEDQTQRHLDLTADSCTLIAGRNVVVAICQKQLPAGEHARFKPHL